MAGYSSIIEEIVRAVYPVPDDDADDLVTDLAVLRKQ